jgi:hypothetical protein
MIRLLAFALAALASGAATTSGTHPPDPPKRDVRLIGRWDITITRHGNAPSWIEIDSSGRALSVGSSESSVAPARSLKSSPPEIRCVSRCRTGRLGRRSALGISSAGRPSVGRMTFPDNATMNWQACARLVSFAPSPLGCANHATDQNDLNGWQPMASNQWAP